MKESNKTKNLGSRSSITDLILSKVTSEIIGERKIS